MTMRSGEVTLGSGVVMGELPAGVPTTSRTSNPGERVITSDASPVNALTLRPDGRLQYGGTVTGGRRVALT